jgi:hypothetical protein
VSCALLSWCPWADRNPFCIPYIDQNWEVAILAIKQQHCCRSSHPTAHNYFEPMSNFIEFSRSIWLWFKSKLLEFYQLERMLIQKNDILILKFLSLFVAWPAFPPESKFYSSTAFFMEIEVFKNFIFQDLNIQDYGIQDWVFGIYNLH